MQPDVSLTFVFKQTWVDIYAVNLFQFGESQRITVLCSELHESHVGWMCQLSDDAQVRKQPGEQRAN